MDAWKPKKTIFDILKEIADYVLIAAMWFGMLIMMVALA